MHFINNEKTRIAYRLGETGKEFNFVAAPGLNEVDEETMDALKGNREFLLHAQRGFIVVLDGNGDPVQPPMDEIINPRAKHVAPPVVGRVIHPTAGAIASAEAEIIPPPVMAPTTPMVPPESVPVVQADDVLFLDAFFKMDEAAQEATMATLDDRMKALVAARKAAV